MDKEKPVAGDMAAPEEPDPEPVSTVQPPLTIMRGYKKPAIVELFEQALLLLSFYFLCFGFAYWLSLGWHAGSF